MHIISSGRHPYTDVAHIPYILGLVFEMIRLRTMEFNRMDQGVENKLDNNFKKNKLNFYQVL